MFQAFRDPDLGRKLLIDENTFIEGNLPHGVVRKLPESVMNHYREPFLDPSSREPIYRFPNELPIAGRPDDVWAMATAYHDWLLDTDLPKLFFHVEPGSLIPPDRARWYSARLKSCRSVALGAGRHYLQEDHGEAIGDHIASWLEILR
jgi:haloalkane dehalogenase